MSKSLQVGNLSELHSRERVLWMFWGNDYRAVEGVMNDGGRVLGAIGRLLYQATENLMDVIVMATGQGAIGHRKTNEPPVIGAQRQPHFRGSAAKYLAS